MSNRRRLEWDWYSGTIPENVVLDETAYVETSFSFHRLRSQLPVAVEYGQGSATYGGTMFDVGPKGHVKIGAYALVHGVHLICDKEILIGDYALISWNVVLMDTYRLPFDPNTRRHEVKRIPKNSPRIADAKVPTNPIKIECNVWIGFDSCILPGVTIGECSVVGARSVVTENVPPYCIVAGNPARLIRYMTPEEKTLFMNQLSNQRSLSERERSLKEVKPN